MAGQPVPDDPGIPADMLVWRRVPPDQIVDDEKNPGQRKLSSAAFCDSDDSEMSVYLCEEGGTLDDCLAGNEGFGVAELRVGDLRDLGFGIVRKPKDGPHHAEVTGPKPPKKRKKIRNIAAVVRWPRPA